MKTKSVIFILLSLLLFAGGCKSSKNAGTRRDGYKSEIRKDSDRKSKDKAKRDIVRKSGNELVAEAERWLGTPYRYGGAERGRGTDCSGLTMTVYRSVLGLKIPRSSAEQQKFCAPLKRDKLEAGDLVFFSSRKGGGRVSHVGLYVADGVFIHASSSRGVIASHLDERYYATHYHSAGRVPGVRKSGKRISGKKKDEGKMAPAIPAIAPEPPVQKADSTARPISAPQAVQEPDSTAKPICEPQKLPTAAPTLPQPSSEEQERADSIAALVRNAF